MSSEETAKNLEKLTRTKLVEEAKKYPEITGAHGMKKEELVAAIQAEREKLGEVVGESAPAAPKPARKKKKKALPSRDALKATLKELKQKRSAALEAKDGTELKRVRRSYKKVNRLLRRVAVEAR